MYVPIVNGSESHSDMFIAATLTLFRAADYEIWLHLQITGIDNFNYRDKHKDGTQILQTVVAVSERVLK